MKKSMLSTKQSYLMCAVGIVVLFGILMGVCESGMASTYIKGIMMTSCIAIIMTTSLNLTIGVLGQLTLGCCGFEAIGAYSAALLSKLLVANGVAMDPTLRFLLTTLAGGVVACIFGILVGIPALRLHGDYLAIITLGFGEIIRVIIQNLKVAGGMGLDKGAAGQALIGIDRLANLYVVFWITVVTVVLITSDSQGNTLIAGTPNNELLQQHFNRWYIPYNKMRQSSEEMYRLEQAGQLTPNTLDSLDKNSQSYMREMRLLSLEFVKENINNPAGKSLLMEIMGLPDRLLVDVVEKADSISLRHPLMQQISQRVNTYKAVAVGKIFQDVTAVNMQDQPSHLSDYAGKGKYVLIDFWASWCKPCCTEMPELKQLYHQYKGKGLEIVSISIDQDKDAWQKKIKELQMNWPQMIDENREASKTYVVGAIPHTILLDPTGIILAKDLRGKELEEKIAQYLK